MKKCNVHGSMACVHGLGVLILGKSGAGKSDCVLELVHQGHKFIADDVVMIEKRGNSLVGQASPNLNHHMHVRGLGILNIKQLFGENLILESQKIDRVFYLVENEPLNDSQHLGLSSPQTKFLGMPVKTYHVPITTHRPLATLIQVALHKEQQEQKTRRHSAKDFCRFFDSQLRSQFTPRLSENS